MSRPGSPAGEFVSRILELAIADSAEAWLAVFSDAAHLEVAGMPAAPWTSSSAVLATCYDGNGILTDGRLTGRWTSVVGAQHADWLVLPARDRRPCRVLVSRQDVCVADTLTALEGAGTGDVTVTDRAIDDSHVLRGDVGPTALRAATGASAAVVGSAVGLWRRHVEQLRMQLAASHRSDEMTDAAAAQVARAASDIDAARLQITDAAAARGDHDDMDRVRRQVVARARSAADRLLEHSRLALDASNSVTHRWRDVDAGSRLAVRLLDALGPPLR